MDFGWGGVVAAAVVVLLLLRYLRARSIVKRHSATLSQITGIPADQIRHEIISGNQTPGEWATRHGLDRWTFTPSADLTNQIKANIAREHPSETILVVSQGADEFSGTLVAVAVTDQAVHFESQAGSDRFEYSSIDSVEQILPTEGHHGLVFIKGSTSEGISTHFVDADAVVAAIEGQLAKITLYTERVELTQDGGALFRWRLGWTGEYVWVIQYDPSLIGPDDRPTAEADAASSEAIKRLNQHIDGGPATHEGRT